MRFRNQETPDKPIFRPQSKKLLDQVAEVMRYHHYSKRSEESYVRWIKQFILFNAINGAASLIHKRFTSSVSAM